MADVHMTICDNCTAQKKQTNHWYRLYADVNAGFLLITPEDTQPDAVKYCDPWDEKAIACGKSCVHVMAERFLTSRRLKP